MKINGKEFYFDIADIESMEKYNTALEEMQLESKNAPTGLSAVEKMKHAYNLITNFFEKVLGEGAAAEIFGEQRNIRVAWETYETFVNECSEECQSLTQTFGKYSSNRAQRRSN